MIPPDYSVEAQPASEDIANALQVLNGIEWVSGDGRLVNRARPEDFIAIRNLLEAASGKLKLGAVSPAAQDTPQ